MDTANLIAIDTHTHLEVSCWNPFDHYGEEYDRAADKYFRSSKRPAMANSDIMIAFGSVDPHMGRMGAREVRKLIESHGVKGFKFHPTVQGFEPYDRMAWPLYEVIAEYKLPAIFHSGHSGIGSGMRCGGGLRLQNSNPMLLDERLC